MCGGEGICVVESADWLGGWRPLAPPLGLSHPTSVPEQRAPGGLRLEGLERSL